MPSGRDDRIVGTLLGTSLGDALGLPCEGMSAEAIRRRWGRITRFHLFGATGFVSDDTQQSVLVAEALARTRDHDACVAHFRRSLLLWFLTLPFGIGFATLRACLRILLGLQPSGVLSAGNGAAMRAAVIGAAIDDRASRLAYGRSLAQVTHRDPRAVDGALYVAELCALCVRSQSRTDRAALAADALVVVEDPRLRSALARALELALRTDVSLEHAAREIGTSGFVAHSVPFALFCFVRLGGSTLDALAGAISAGGDTDSFGAILGGWLGALHGEGGLPADLVRRIQDGAYGPTHLRALGRALSTGEGAPARSWLASLASNLALYPVVIGHGVRRLLP